MFLIPKTHRCNQRVRPQLCPRFTTKNIANQQLILKKPIHTNKYRQSSSENDIDNPKNLLAITCAVIKKQIATNEITISVISRCLSIHRSILMFAYSPSPIKHLCLAKIFFCTLKCLFCVRFKSVFINASQMRHLNPSNNIRREFST